MKELIYLSLFGIVKLLIDSFLDAESKWFDKLLKSVV